MVHCAIRKRTWNAVKKYCSGLLHGGRRWIFRGQSCESWGLTPKIERLLGVDGTNRFVELELIRQLRRRIHHYLGPASIPAGSAETLSLVQHYGGPTRLLDWTFSYYVAAYFMFEEKQVGENRALWAINFDWLRDKALSTLRKEMDPSIEIVDKNQTRLLDDEIFAKILWADFPAIVPVDPQKLNDRIMVQNGLFLMGADSHSSFEQNFEAFGSPECEQNIIKLTLPENKRDEVLGELQLMNITAEYLFPGVEGLTKSLNYQAEAISEGLRVRP